MSAMFIRVRLLLPEISVRHDGEESCLNRQSGGLLAGRRCPLEVRLARTGHKNTEPGAVRTASGSVTARSGEASARWLPVRRDDGTLDMNVLTVSLLRPFHERVGA